MREIKFRAWDTMAHKMEPVGEITFDTGLEVAIGNHNGKTRSVNVQYQPHIILMQYTGLHDKTGKEIYEGDIVHSIAAVPGDGDDLVGVIRYLETSWVIENKRKQIAEPLFSESKEREILGNICENLELLEGK
ncbi:YopX family protein [Schleiferilactobacillus harbinensis]|uniref:YopX protein domain-containing protein n=1 Tax=Schleiferilactobacillus harbinensis TaxID=304207 RepID=A0A5P8M744_9LACO|nr:YopX family protein [Schleiferilactobacillus harbinensis]QFR24104.1 hypothetical protein D1010_12310 [Schleiferilactobacillus harbinensis]